MEARLARTVLELRRQVGRLEQQPLVERVTQLVDQRLAAVLGQARGELDALRRDNGRLRDALAEMGAELARLRAERELRLRGAEVQEMMEENAALRDRVAALEAGRGGGARDEAGEGDGAAREVARLQLELRRARQEAETLREALRRAREYGVRMEQAVSNLTAEF